MCNIWKDKGASSLSLEQIDHIFSRNDFSFVQALALTGGEPTMRADLPQLFEILLERLPNLERVLLATNGLNTSRTLEHVHRMLETLANKPNRVFCFHAQVSLDGVGEVHDTMRGVPGSFQKVQATLSQLRALQDRFPVLRLRSGCVLVPYNLPFVESLDAFAEKEGISICYSPAILADTYFNNLDQAGELVFNGKSRVAARQLFERLGQRDETNFCFYYRDVANMLQDRPRGRRCMMGFYNFVLEHDGTVYPCPTYEKTGFGNLLTDSFEDLWFGERANEVRRQVRAQYCPTCSSTCYPSPINALELAQMVWRQKIKGRLRGPSRSEKRRRREV
jgi:MoaA/NifB/PqqE/SkfB family radical SAM enzyme